MNLPEGINDLGMGWEGSKLERNEMIKLHRVDNNPTPKECVAEYEFGKQE